MPSRSIDRTNGARVAPPAQRSAVAVGGRIEIVRNVVGLALAVLAVATVACKEAAPRLRLATTTSVDNSGLLQELLPSFRQESGIDVQVLAVGSGRALDLLRRGDADVALTHDPVGEAAFLKEASSATYRKVMFNDFVLVAPTRRPTLGTSSCKCGRRDAPYCVRRRSIRVARR